MHSTLVLQEMLQVYLSSNTQIVEATCRRNRRIFERFMGLFGPETQAQAIRKRHAVQFQATLRGAGCSPSTVNSYCASVASVFGWFCMLGELESNPFARIGKVVVEDKPVAYYTEDELPRLLEAVEALPWRDPTAKIRWRGLLLVLYHTGARIGEALNLRWSDIDLDRALIRIQARDDEPGVHWAWGTKGHRNRTLPLSQELLEHLYRMQVVCPWLYPILPAGRCRFLQVRVGQLGDTIRNSPYNNLYRQWQRVKAQAGIKSDGAFHKMRSTAATELSERLLPSDLQRILGHRSLVTTQGYIGLRSSRFLTDCRNAMNARRVEVEKD